MMDKKTFDINTEFQYKTMSIQDKTGNDIMICDRIPYEEKEEFVKELVAMSLAVDENLGYVYVTMNHRLVWNYLFVKYYTNIDVSEVQDIEGFKKLYDFCIGIGLEREDVDEFTFRDLAIVEKMEAQYADAIIELYEREHSLGQLVKEMLNTNPDTTNDETRELIEKLTDMKGALLEKEEKEKLLQFGKKKPASIGASGNVINFAKKNVPSL